ncbi:MAG TPA: co-chaperone GroES [Candidatus Pacearchaeota archaeon]|nr:co-chaperone GroES [Candidatus Pacearchaeota archaeon]HPR79657.1 co-chaperone GroES [Candidatus Pacearchaeota archaeon]
MKIKPLSSNIVIEQLKAEEKNKGKILLLQSTEKDGPQQGKVIAVGPGKRNSQGKAIPMEIKKGDIILFSKYTSHEIKIGDKNCLVLKEEDVLGIIEE